MSTSILSLLSTFLILQQYCTAAVARDLSLASHGPAKLAQQNTLPRYRLLITGDSYTTTGFRLNGTHPSVQNPFGNPPYPGVTLSGGENWVDILVKDHLPNGTLVYNLAVGGNPVNITRVDSSTKRTNGTVQDMIDQINELERLGKNVTNISPERTLMMNWFGINDVSLAGLYTSNPYSEVQRILTADVQDYFALLDRAFGLGVRNFINVFMPPLQRAPIWSQHPSTRTDEARNLTYFWNHLISRGTTTFLAQHAGARMSNFDPAPTFNRILDSYQAYGAPNNTCFSYPAGTPCLWHDFIHPGLVIQKALGDAVGEYVHDNGFV